MDAPPSDELYDLIGNVVHESTAGTTRDKANTVWKVQLRAERVEDSSNSESADEKWFQLQDLVVEEVQKEMIFLGETVLQVRLSSTSWINSHPLRRCGRNEIKVQAGTSACQCSRGIRPSYDVNRAVPPKLRSRVRMRSLPI